MNNKPNNKLLNGCSSILEQHSKNIHRNISLVGNNDPYFSMTCRDALHVNHNNHVYNVATFKDLDNLGFNFALKFNISVVSPKRLSYTLTEGNLRVFHLNDNKSQLLFRAEFATNNLDEQHAQPHWQFEPYLIKAIKETDYNSVIELRESETEIVDFQQEQSTNINISKIHFAMTSDWHKAKKDRVLESYRVAINNENIVHWLEGCMKYIQSQIEILK